jgi:hypothetical protein
MSGRSKKTEQESQFWRRTTPNPQKGKRGKESLPGDHLPPPPRPATR